MQVGLSVPGSYFWGVRRYFYSRRGCGHAVAVTLVGCAGWGRGPERPVVGCRFSNPPLSLSMFWRPAVGLTGVEAGARCDAVTTKTHTYTYHSIDHRILSPLFVGSLLVVITIKHRSSLFCPGGPGCLSGLRFKRYN